VKFVVDRQRKHFDGSLPPTGRREEIRLEGSESLIIDEGNGFFSLTNGDIISQSIEIISELGCLFDVSDPYVPNQSQLEVLTLIIGEEVPRKWKG
jgi:hypothetical protein